MRVKPFICAVLTFSTMYLIFTAKNYELAAFCGFVNLIAFKLED